MKATYYVEILKKKSFYNLLICLNFIVGLIIFYVYRNYEGADTFTYNGLGESILRGQYSFWYFLPVNVPDTFRNPGYPLFLAFLKLFSHSLMFIKIIQLGLYFLSIKFILDIIDFYFNTIEVKNIFLLLLLPSIYIVPFAAHVFSEMLTTFLITLSVRCWIKLKDENWTKFIYLGLLYGFIFQVRPTFILFPFILTAWAFYKDRQKAVAVRYLLLLIIFVLTMIPYGIWNYKNNGVFKITSIEGGAGVIQIGYWGFKMPDYRENHYWGNASPREMVSFVDSKDVPANIVAFNADWDKINAGCAGYLTSTDSIMLDSFAVHGELFKTFNSKYTLARESLIKDYTFNRIKNDIPFYIKTRLYTAIRLWVTGIPLKEYNAASGANKLKMIYGFAVTAFIFLMAVVFIPLAIVRNKKEWKNLVPHILLIAYFGIIHVPFVIQARYTIPVRLILLFLISISIYFLFVRSKNNLQKTSL